MSGINTGLVLEGGGLRGVYTAGVLDFFMDNNFYAPYCIGVSAGACHIFSYLSRQRGRGFKVTTDYINDPRYLSVRSLLFKGEIFGMDFMFDEIPKKLIPFDYDTFESAAEEFIIGVTNCISGKAEYFSNKEGHDMFLMGRASSSLPVLSKAVDLYGTPYLDGGIADPIPIKKAEADGFEKNIVILTRNAEYRKSESKYTVKVMERVYKKYPELAKSYSRRAAMYNNTLEYIERLEKEGKVFIIRPLKPVSVGRTEKDMTKLKALYNEGYDEAKALWPKLEAWLGNTRG
ncbi:patatin family protein [Tyzzerella sp. OttesenSCG-928-J15]|nr:patatin family protein [Tyzzerella sp. OttesenSCG-928-J15]